MSSVPFVDLAKLVSEPARRSQRSDPDTLSPASAPDRRVRAVCLLCGGAVLQVVKYARSSRACWRGPTVEGAGRDGTASRATTMSFGMPIAGCNATLRAPPCAPARPKRSWLSYV